MRRKSKKVEVPAIPQFESRDLLHIMSETDRSLLLEEHHGSPKRLTGPNDHISGIVYAIHGKIG